MPMRPDLVQSLSASIRERRESPRKERRQSTRKDGLSVGIIAYGRDRRKMHCVLLDISDGGAKLVPADRLNCPDRFSLAIIDQPTRDCEVVWREHSRVGVKFV
jgi:c-di-GMP-binding flagellar brake protein YcgR